MLSKQKHIKDTRGLGYDFGECSTSKDVSHKDIQFVSSSGDNKSQTFRVRSSPRKKVDLTTTGEDMSLMMKTDATRGNNIYPKEKRNLRKDRFTGNKNTRRQPKISPTHGRQRDVGIPKNNPQRSISGEAKPVKLPHVW